MCMSKKSFLKTNLNFPKFAPSPEVSKLNYTKPTSLPDFLGSLSLAHRGYLEKLISKFCDINSKAPMTQHFSNKDTDLVNPTSLKNTPPQIFSR